MKAINPNRYKRLEGIFQLALPAKGTEAYARAVENHKKRLENEPGLKKHLDECLDKAIAIIKTQLGNGAGLPMDSEIREFLSEFNGRTFEHGLRAMPSSFNILEAYFNYQQKFNFFELLEEENYLFSVFDFIDFITSPDFKEDKKLISEHFIEDLIYHYDISNNLDSITFTTEEGDECVIGGVSLIRRGDEVIVFLLSGLHSDTFDLPDIEHAKIIRGKEGIKAGNGTKFEAIKLFEKPNYWKTLASCRIDLTRLKIDARYVQKDIGIGYVIITDDISGLLDESGNFLEPELEKIYEEMNKAIESFTPIFEFATKCLYLPYYFDKFEASIYEEQHPTQLSEAKEKPAVFRRDKIVPNTYKIRNRTAFCLDRNTQPKSDIVSFGENDYQIERSGYWKPLEYNAIGTDKSGNPIHHKTWVNKILTWHEKTAQNLTVNLKKPINQTLNAANEGYVYIMRNASQEIDIFKIGVTTRDAETRAKELSSSTGVPDKYLVANKWFAKDCFLAESIIHEKLAIYRVNKNREFFKIDYQIVIKTINEVINLVNNAEPSK